MKKPKRPRDANQLAKFLVDAVTGGAQEAQAKSRRAEGGKIGGKARAAKLTPEQRREIARSGAEKRWKKAGPTE